MSALSKSASAPSITRGTTLLRRESKVCLRHAVAVDGLEVIVHGDDMVANLAPQSVRIAAKSTNQSYGLAYGPHKEPRSKQSGQKQ